MSNKSPILWPEFGIPQRVVVGEPGRKSAVGDFDCAPEFGDVVQGKSKTISPPAIGTATNRPEQTITRAVMRWISTFGFVLK
jgi:hypothetical protein